MTSKKKAKVPSTAPSTAFAVDFNQAVGTTFVVTGDFWNLKGDEAKDEFECTVLEYDRDHMFADLRANQVLGIRNMIEIGLGDTNRYLPCINLVPIGAVCSRSVPVQFWRFRIVDSITSNPFQLLEEYL